MERAGPHTRLHCKAERAEPASRACGLRPPSRPRSGRWGSSAHPGCGRAAPRLGQQPAGPLILVVLGFQLHGRQPDLLAVGVGLGASTAVSQREQGDSAAKAASLGAGPGLTLQQDPLIQARGSTRQRPAPKRRPAHKRGRVPTGTDAASVAAGRAISPRTHPRLQPACDPPHTPGVRTRAGRQDAWGFGMAWRPPGLGPSHVQPSPADTWAVPSASSKHSHLLATLGLAGPQACPAAPQGQVRRGERLAGDRQLSTCSTERPQQAAEGRRCRPGQSLPSAFTQGHANFTTLAWVTTHRHVHSTLRFVKTCVANRCLILCCHKVLGYHT